ncbi:MAG: hypothetical protein IT438_05795 [Phycisphaerales bacterium]|nr:hypothetical protein [Phycisphaerales bacterium]
MRSLAASALLSSLAIATPAPAATVTVHVYDFDFSQNLVGQPIVHPTINLGDSIHWVWDSGFHSVTSISGSTEVFDSGNRLPPFTFDYTFTRLGVHTYYCRLHGFDPADGTPPIGMVGTVTVVPSPGAALPVAAASLFALARRRRR